MKVTLVLMLLVVIFAVLSVNGQKFSSRRRRSKEIEERINNLDEGTKKRIHAMKASGMPKEAIAEKIAYVAGGKNIAKRIVDALHDEPPKTKGPATSAGNPAKKTATPPKASTPPKTTSPPKKQPKK